MVINSVFLTYHELGPTPKPYSYYMPVDRFKEHLRICNDIRRGSDRLPVFTFDDGHRSHYEYAHPLLQEMGLTGMFFITAAWMGKQVDYMSWSQVRELAAYGHAVHSHGWSHKLLTAATELELEEELARSKDIIEQELSSAIDAIAVPGGRWNTRVVRACFATGYKRVFTSDPPKFIQKEGMQVFGRLIVQQPMTGEQLRRLLSSQGLSLWLYGAKHKLKYLSRRILGERTYEQLWRWKSGFTGEPS